MKLQKNLTQVAIKFGLMGAVMNILALVVLFYLGKHPLLLNPLLDTRWPLFSLFIFFSIKMYRDENGGILHFWEGLVIGILVYVIMAIGGVFFVYIFSEIKSTFFLSEFIRIKTEQLIENKEMYIDSKFIGEETYNQAILGLPNTQAIQLAYSYLKQSILIALLPTILLPILMRRSLTV